jgi:hypothetical protein
MNDPLKEFADACETAGVDLFHALREGGVGRSTWFNWQNGSSSPTLRSLRKAHEGLERAKSATAPAGG